MIDKIVEAVKEKVSNTQEEMFIILIDINNNIIDVMRLFTGGKDFIEVDMSIIIEVCLTTSAKSFILMHNHIGEDITPSEEDIHMVEEINAMARKLNLVFRDHIIFSKKVKEWTSIIQTLKK